MNETVTNELLLEHLKRLQSGQARLIEDVGDLKLRMTALEESNATMAHAQATMAQSIAGQSKRMDRIENRLDRIERRLDLADTPAG